MSNKTTRKALVSSIVALLICVTMLMGTTFAWFTDTATVAVNTITSGTLKIKVVDTDNQEITELSFVNKDGSADILWEPGATFNTKAFKVVNDGNLALKFKVEVTGIEGDAGLLKVIDFKLVGPEGVAEEVSLGKGETSGEYYISGTMDTEAGNEYQTLTLSGIKITVYATQDTVEYDSTTNTYDANATYAAAETVVYDEGEHTVDLGEVDYIFKGTDIQDTYAAIKVNDTGSATITGNGKVDITADENVSTAIAVWARNGADIVIENGTFILERVEGNTNELELIYASDTVNDGNTTTITIKGGTFKCDNAYKTINIHGSGSRNDAEAFVYVQGGTFWEFNPATDSEDDHVIIPEGYKVVSEEKADGTWYTVVPE